MSVITGTSDNDTLVGTRGDDTISGLGGDDVLIGGAGADQMIGGRGLDTASYANAHAGVYVEFDHPTWNLGDAQGDTFDSVENLLGSKFGDHLAGSDAGNNRISGGNGDDSMYGNNGADSLIGGAGDDYMDAGSLDKKANLLDGGKGSDFLVAYGGRDVLSGGADIDTLIGGGGADNLTGGGGGDVFRFTAATDSRSSAMDLITDLDQTDHIDLTAFSIDASGVKVHFDSNTGETLISVDVDMDGHADLKIRVAGDHSHPGDIDFLF